MALTYDTKARIPTSGCATIATSASTTYTCGTNAGALVVFINWAGTTARTGGDPTYAGSSLTQAHLQTGVTETALEAWYMLNPPSNTPLTVDVPNTGGRTMWVYIASGVETDGAKQFAFDSSGSNATTGASPSVSLTAITSPTIIFAGVATGDNSFVPTARTGNVIYEEDIATYGSAFQYYNKTGTGAQTLSWTEATSDDYGAIAIAFGSTTKVFTLTVSTVTQLQNTSAIVLTQYYHSEITVQDSIHPHISDNVILTSHEPPILLTIQNTEHAHISENIILTARGPPLEIQNTTQTQTSQKITLDYFPVLTGTYYAKTGSFNIDITKTASETQFVRVGFQPKIVLFWWSGSTSTSNTVAGGTINKGFGAGISSSSRFSVVGISEDAQTSSDSYSYQDATSVIRTYTAVGALDGLADIASLDADGFTLTIDDQFSNPYLISYLALGGTDLTNVFIGSKQTPNSLGEYSVTGVGFQPDAVILAGAYSSTETGGAATSHFSMSMGTGSDEQSVVYGRANDGVIDTITYRYGRMGEIRASSGQHHSLVSFGTDGFTLNNLLGIIQLYYFFICLKGGQYRVGDITTRTDGNDIAETVDFQPVGILFLSVNQTQSTYNVLASEDRLSIGAATSESVRMVQAISDEDAQADSKTAHANYNNAVYAHIEDDAIVGLMDLKSIEPDGFTCVMDEPDSGDYWVTYLAIGETTRLEVNNSVQAQTSDNTNLLEHYIITIQYSTQIQASGNVILIQNYVLTVQNAAQAQTSQKINPDYFPVLTGNYYTKAGSFNVDINKTVTETQFVRVGFQPKLVMLWWSGSNNLTDGASGGSYNYGYSYFSASEKLCWNEFSVDNVGTSDTYSVGASEKAIRIFADTTPTAEGGMDVYSLDSDGFTLIVDNQFSNPLRVSYLALGGIDITNIKINTFTTPGSTGLFDVTDVGFKPDALIMCRSSTGNRSTLSLGFATSSSTQGVISNISVDNVATSDTAGYGYNGEVMALCSTAIPGITYRLSFDSFLDNGFKLNCLEGTSTAHWYVAIKGGQYDVGNLTTRGDSNEIMEKTGFQPSAILFASTNRALSSQDASSNNSRMSIGAATSTSNRTCQAMSDEDNLDTTETAYGNYDTAVYAHIKDDSTEALLDIKSIDSSGFTAIMDDGESSTGCWVTYLAMGASPLLEVNNSTQAQTSDNVILTPHYILTVQNSTQTQTADNVILTAYSGVITLTVQNSTQIQTSDNVSLTQCFTLSVNSTIQLHTADGNTITFTEIEDIILIVNYTLTVQNSAHVQTSDNIIITYIPGTATLTVQDSIQTQTSDNVSLTQHYSLTVQNATHLQSVNNYRFVDGDDGDINTECDSNVYSENYDLNYGSSDRINTGNNAPNWIRHGFIKYTLSTLVGKTITSATLYLYQYSPFHGTTSTSYIYRILPVNIGWTESGITWNHIDGTNHWAGDTGNDGGTDAGCSVEGTDYSSTLMGQIDYVAGRAEGYEYPITLNVNEVNLMVNNNAGIVLNTDFGGDALVVWSSDDTSQYGPKLVVEYTIPLTLTQNYSFAVNNATQTQASDSVSLTQHYSLTVQNSTHLQNVNNYRFVDGFGGDVQTYKDTNLLKAPPTYDYGTQQTMYVGRYDSNNLYRGLIQFVVSSIPSNATITSGTLTLYCTAETVTTDYNVMAHRGLVQWYEGVRSNQEPGAGEDASVWNYRNFNGSVAWGTAGGLADTDYTSAATATVSITGTDTTFDFVITTDVAAWVAGTATNYGSWLIGNQESDNTTKQFATSDNPTTANRPKLVVLYTTPISLTQNYSLTVQNSTQAQTADNIALTQYFTLTINNATHIQISIQGFPTTPLLDNFNRADESPIVGNWSGPIYEGHSPLSIKSYQLAESTGMIWSNSYWNSSFNQDQEVWITYSTLSEEFNHNFGLVTRIVDPNGTSLDDYLLYCEPDNEQITIYKHLNNSASQLNQTSFSFASGQKIGFSSIGNIHTGYVDMGNGWQPIISVQDSTFPNGGYIGVYSDRGQNARFDDFGGGNYNIITNIILSQNYSLILQDSSHLQTSENINLTSPYVLIVQNTAHIQTTTTPLVVQEIKGSTLNYWKYGIPLAHVDSWGTNYNTTDYWKYGIPISRYYIEGAGITVQSSSHLHTSENVTITYHEISAYVLTVQNSIHVQTSENITLTQHQILVVNNATQIQTSENISLSQHQTLIINDVTQLQTSDNIALTQHYTIVVNNASQAQTSESVVLSAHYTLIIQNTQQVQTAENIILTQHYILGINNSQHLHISDNIILAQNYTLAIQNTQQVQKTRFNWWIVDGISASSCAGVYQAKGVGSYSESKINIANPGTYTLTENASQVTWTTENGWQFFNDANFLKTGIIPKQNGSWAIKWSDNVADNSGGIFGQMGTLYTRSHLSPWRTDPSAGFSWSNGWSNNVSGITFTGGIAVSRPGRLLINGLVYTGNPKPGDATMEDYIGGINNWGYQACKVQAFAEYDIALSDIQSQKLSEQIALVGITELPLTQHFVLAINNAEQIQTSEIISLSQTYALIVQDGEHVQTADNIIVTYYSGTVVLTVQNAVQSQVSENIALSAHYAIIVADATQTQTSENVTLTQHQVLVVNNATQGLTSDNVSLSAHYAIVVSNATQAQTAEILNLRVSYGLLVDIDHETGDLSQYDYAVTDSGDLSVTSGAAMANSEYGLSALIDDTVIIYGVKEQLKNTSGKIRFRFYYDFTNVTMATGNTFYFMVNYTSASLSIAGLYLSQAATYKNLVFSPLDDAPATKPLFSGSLSNGVHYVEALVTRATGSATNDGSGTIWIDGIQKDTRADIDNYHRFNDYNKFFFGATYNIQSGTTGTLYLDELVVRDDGAYIGPANYAHGTDVTHIQTSENIIIIPRFSLTVEDGIHLQASETINITPHYTLYVNNATQAQTSDNVVLTQHQVLATNNATHVQTSENIVLTQHMVGYLVVQNPIQTQTSENIVLTARVPHFVLVIIGSYESLLLENGAYLLQENGGKIALDSSSAKIILHHTAENVNLLAHYSITVNNATQVHTSENTALTQHHILAVNNATQAQTSENTALTQHHILVVNNATQVQTSENIALTQNYILSVNNAAQTQTSENVVLTQHYILSVNNATQTQTSENIILTQHYVLFINSSTQTQISENVALTQHYVLSVNNATQAQISETIVLTQNYLLSVNNTTQVQTSESIILIQHQVLAINNAVQGQTSESISLIQHHVLFINHSTHAQIAENVVLIQHMLGYLDVQNATHGQVVDNVQLIQHYILWVNDSSHIQTGENTNLSAHYAIVVNNASQTHISENVSLFAHYSLVVGNANHIQTSESVNLTAHYTLTIQNAAHIQVSDNTILTQHHVLLISDSAHVQTSQIVSLTQHHVLLISDSIHYHTSEKVTLVEHMLGVLLVQPAIQQQTAETLSLVQHHVLGIHNSTHEHSSDNVSIIMSQTISVDNADHMMISYQVVAVESDYILTKQYFGFFGMPELYFPFVISRHLILIHHPPISTITVNNSTHIHTADNVILTGHIPTYSLAVNHAAQIQTSENIILTQHHILIINSTTQGQTSENITLTQHQILIINHATQLQTGDKVNLLAHYAISVNNITQTQTSQNVILSAHYSITVNSATQLHTADDLELIVHLLGVLSVRNAVHVHTAQNVALTQHHILGILDAVQSHTADYIDISGHYVIGAVNNPTHIQTADNIILTFHNVLVVHNAVHIQTSENVYLTQNYILTLENTVHVQTSDNIILSAHYIIAVLDNTVHLQSADNIVLVFHNVLTIQDAVHAQTSDNIELKQNNLLIISNAVQVQTSEIIAFSQNYVLTINSCIQLQTATTIRLVYFVITPIGAGRLYIIEPENRTYVIPCEPRENEIIEYFIYIIEPENRTHTIEIENRILYIER